MVLAVPETASRVGWLRVGVTETIVDNYVVGNFLAEDMSRVQTSGPTLRPYTSRPFTCTNIVHTSVRPLH